MEIAVPVQKSSRFIRWQRKAIFKLLSQLQEGKLVLIEGNQRFEFGNENSELNASVTVLDPQFYNDVFFGGEIGAAEAWVEGKWTTNDLTKVIQIFAKNMSVVDKIDGKFGWLLQPFRNIFHMLNRNSKSGSKRNIAAHYDLGNDMYELFLDPLMQYSSALFPSANATLEQAQEHKLKIICDKLQLCDKDHLLEIGTGWGGLACYAAKHYGCQVTTTTLSKEQYKVAQKRAVDEKVEDKVTILLKDYRDLKGTYDKLVSVEMIEAVGHEYLPVYFEKLNTLLKPAGRMLIQSITIADSRYDYYRKTVDFIQKYIFPGGCLPSVKRMTQLLSKNTNMELKQITAHGIDYADTLKIWAERFSSASARLNALGYKNDFQRLWKYYFSYCEGGFREGTIDLVHFEAVKPKA